MNILSTQFDVRNIDIEHLPKVRKFFKTEFSEKPDIYKKFYVNVTTKLDQTKMEKLCQLAEYDGSDSGPLGTGNGKAKYSYFFYVFSFNYAKFKRIIEKVPARVRNSQV